MDNGILGWPGAGPQISQFSPSFDIPGVRQSDGGIIPALGSSLVVGATSVNMQSGQILTMSMIAKKGVSTANVGFYVGTSNAYYLFIYDSGASSVYYKSSGGSLTGESPNTMPSNDTFLHQFKLIFMPTSSGNYINFTVDATGFIIQADANAVILPGPINLGVYNDAASGTVMYDPRYRLGLT